MSEPDNKLRQGDRYANLIGLIAPVVAQEVNDLLVAVLKSGESLTRTDCARDYDHIADHMLNVIRETQSVIYSFSILAHQVRPRKEMVDVNLILREVLDEKTEEISDADIQLIIQFDLGVSKIQADREMLKEAFIQIVSNAIDALRSIDGIRQFLILTTESEDTIEIAFEDTGPGIPKAAMADIFRPFFTTKGPNHKGLGLSVCTSVLKKHQGSISAQDRESQGTVIIVSLPIINT